MSIIPRGKFKGTPMGGFNEDYESIKDTKVPQPTYPELKKFPRYMKSEELPLSALICRELRENNQNSAQTRWVLNKKWSSEDKSYISNLNFLPKQLHISNDCPNSGLETKRYKPFVLNSFEKLMHNLDKIQEVGHETEKSEPLENASGTSVSGEDNSDEDNDYNKDHFVDEDNSGEGSENEPTY